MSLITFVEINFLRNGASYENNLFHIFRLCFALYHEKWNTLYNIDNNSSN